MDALMRHSDEDSLVLHWWFKQVLVIGNGVLRIGGVNLRSHTRLLHGTQDGSLSR
jgi:hypothetical protein